MLANITSVPASRMTVGKPAVLASKGQMIIQCVVADGADQERE